MIRQCNGGWMQAPTQVGRVGASSPGELEWQRPVMTPMRPVDDFIVLMQPLSPQRGQGVLKSRWNLQPKKEAKNSF